MNSATIPRLSVVIPAYNEASRIGDTLRSLQAYFSGRDYETELIVVNDGSADDTAAAVRQGFPDVRLISYARNTGKGYAVTRGMQEARGAIRLFYDADGSTPIDEVAKIWPEFEKGAEVVIGSRALPESDIEIRQPLYRQTMGKTYNLLLRVLGLTSFPDTQCGFKAMTAEATKIIMPRVTMNGYGADCEMLYIAQVHGIPVAQIPVRWLNSPDTRVHAIWDSLTMIREVLTVRLNAWRGRYRA